MRAFLAFPVENIFGKLRKRYDYEKKLKWVNRYHITLQFMKDFDENDLVEISDEINKIIKKYPPFFIKDPIIELVPEKRPKILWVRFREVDEMIFQLEKKIKIILRDFGYRTEKRVFKPHITLARIRGKPTDEFIKKLFLEKVKTENIYLNKLVFYQSILKPTGARHIPIGFWRVGE